MGKLICHFNEMLKVTTSERCTFAFKRGFKKHRLIVYANIA